MGNQKQKKIMKSLLLILKPPSTILRHHKATQKVLPKSYLLSFILELLRGNKILTCKSFRGFYLKFSF